MNEQDFITKLYNLLEENQCDYKKAIEIIELYFIWKELKEEYNKKPKLSIIKGGKHDE